MTSAAAEVVARRSIAMSRMSNPPSVADQRELSTMVTEKVAASQQSAVAMMTSATLAASNFWWAQWTGGARVFSARTPTLTESAASASRATAKILSAGMQPYRKRAVSNARRLRKGKPTKS
jgi:hypothetical protein